MKRISILVLVSLNAAACGNDPRSGAGEEPLETDPPSRVDVGFDPVEDPDPEPQALTWCAPQAASYDQSQIPPVPVGFDPDRFCDASTLAPEEGVPTRIVTYDPTVGVLEVVATTDFGPGDGRVTYSFDELGRLREVFRVGAQGFYSIGVGSTRYELDEAGRLTRKEASQTFFPEPSESASEVIETLQTWDGLRLVSRDVRFGDGGPLLQALTWDYDPDGRLVRAQVNDAQDPDATRTDASVWTYHETGQPASVERFVDGVRVERESWTFDDAGALTARTFESASLDTLAAEHGGDRWDWSPIQRLDTYQAFSDDPFMDDPWHTALPVANGECWMLPRGPGHGYPDGEPEYQLAVPRDERPERIGFDYGNTSYGWRYGDVAWYGHDGLGSGWFGSSNWGSGLPDLAVEVRYSDGRMTAESATVALFSGGPALALERERTFDDGQLIADRVSLVGPDEATPERVLRFGRDAAGSLVERALWVGDERLGRQTWQRDDRGRALAHTLDPFDALPTSLDLWEQSFQGFGDGPIVGTQWYWRYDGDRLSERGGGPGDLHEERFYDDRGRLVEVLGRFESFDVNGSERLTYDELDRVTELCTSYDTTIWTCASTIFDELGRVAWRESWQEGEEPVVIELNDYRCAP